MEFISSIIAWFSTPTAAAAFAALWAISEALALIPSVKANGIFDAIVKGLAWLKAKFPVQPPVA